MPTASPSDVKVEIDTGLSDPDLDDILTRVERDVDRMASPPADGTNDRQDLEAVLAALRIATGQAPEATDRTASQVSTGSTSKSFDASTVEGLKRRARFLGADEQLLASKPQASFEAY